jgi:hypothetical protein
MPASIFNGDAVKILKDKLRFKSGTDLELDSSDNLATTGDFAVFKDTSKEFTVGQEVFEVMSTGLDSFDGLAINGGDSTKFDVGDVDGHIADFAADSYYDINYTAQTGLTPSTANGVTYVFIDNTGSIAQQTTAPSAQDRREMLYLGRVITVGGTFVQVQDEPVIVPNVANQLYDLAKAIRIFNVSGNIISPNGSNLNIDKSAGSVFSIGGNFTTNSEDPHEITIAASSPTTFAYFTQTLGS